MHRTTQVFYSIATVAFDFFIQTLGQFIKKISTKVIALVLHSKMSYFVVSFLKKTWYFWYLITAASIYLAAPYLWKGPIFTEFLKGIAVVAFLIYVACMNKEQSRE